MRLTITIEILKASELNQELLLFRTFNGWCNNLKDNPQYGKSVTPLVRFLSAKYDDGKNSSAFIFF